VESEKLTD